MKTAKVNFGETIGSGDCFWGTTLNEVRYLVEGYSALDSTMEPQYPETVELHFWKCYGGEVFEGYAIYNYIRGLASKGIKVICYSHGLIASIAVLVYLAGDERYADDASQAFTHKPSVDLGAFPNADTMRTEANNLDKIQQQIVNVYVSRAGVTAEQAHAFLNSEAWQTADEMVGNGFATEKTNGELVAPAGAEKVINYFKPQTPQNMAISAAEKEGIVNDVINGIKNFFAPRNEAPAPAPVVNLALTLDDGTSVYVDASGDDIAQGDMVYTDESMSQAVADADYKLEDGRTISVASGAITAITEASNEAPAPATNAAELSAATARIAELEQQLGVTTNKLTLATNKLKAVPGSTGNPTGPGNQNPGSKAANAAASSPFSIKRT